MIRDQGTIDVFCFAVAIAVLCTCRAFAAGASGADRLTSGQCEKLTFASHFEVESVEIRLNWRD